jgi:hypothetical protein
MDSPDTQLTPAPAPAPCHGSDVQHGAQLAIVQTVLHAATATPVVAPGRTATADDLEVQQHLDGLDTLAIAQQRSVARKHPLTGLPAFAPSEAEWRTACTARNIALPGAPAADVDECLKEARGLMGKLRLLGRRGPEADLPVPEQGRYEAELRRHTRPRADFRAGACHRYHRVWEAVAEDAACASAFSEELAWLAQGVTFQKTQPDAPAKAAEPRHEQRVAGCRASMRASGYSDAEFEQFCSRQRPEDVVLSNHLDDPKHLSFAREKVKEGLARVQSCAGHLPTAAH